MFGKKSCFRYHKGTDFQANHNFECYRNERFGVVLDTTKVQIFKQITTLILCAVLYLLLFQIPQRYRFSSKSQLRLGMISIFLVVLDTTKVQIFKQITTTLSDEDNDSVLFQIPQRYRFSSKSQLYQSSLTQSSRCFRYHKGTDFQANHNVFPYGIFDSCVVLDTTKVQIFKQITTKAWYDKYFPCCFRYHKGTDFQANHNRFVTLDL